MNLVLNNSSRMGVVSPSTRTTGRFMTRRCITSPSKIAPPRSRVLVSAELEDSVTKPSTESAKAALSQHEINGISESANKGKERAPMYMTESLEEEAEALEGSSTVVFEDRDGNLKEVMCYDYGYRTGTGRMYQSEDGTIPMSAFELATANFKLELESLRLSIRNDEYTRIASRAPPGSLPKKALFAVGKVVVAALATLDESLERVRLLPALDTKKFKRRTTSTGEASEIRAKLSKLTLSDEAIAERERVREQAGYKVPAPWYTRLLYDVVCVLLDVIFSNRPIQRFWFLETVARMPYFSYISCIHLYETMGWWRAAAELRKIHFAEEWNELHHLQIMESLGGDQWWFDRFIAYHAAIVYYWVLVLMYIASPSVAYNFSELLEAHAVDTYGEFVDANEALLKELLPTLPAVQYYQSSDLYMLDEFQTDASYVRNPKCDSLYDVFVNIRDDEGEHVKTMKACQDASVITEIMARKEKTRRV